MLLGATLDQVIAAGWAGEGSSTYMGRAHYPMERKKRKRGKERGGTDGVMLSLQEFGRSVKRAYFLVFGHFLHFLHMDRHRDQQHVYTQI